MTETQDKLRVLFVDDEPEILNSLRLTLRKERKRWEMEFVESAEAALELMRDKKFDAIVTDMKMPVMDGAELLMRVRDAEPGMCRVVISGYADEQLAMRALAVAHQFLSKPVERDQVVEAIDNTRRLMNLVHTSEFKDLIGDTTCLPATPRLHLELMAALRDSECGVEEVAEIVEQDPAMSAKFLQIANSAYFSLPRTVVKVADAVAFLGFSAVSSIALSTEVLRGFPTLPGLHGMSLSSFQQRSNLTARLAGKIAKDSGLDSNVASTAGVLHGVGLLLLEARIALRYESVWQTAVEEGLSLPDAEQQILGSDHALIGGALLGSWGLPTPVVEAVLHQYEPAVVDGTEFGIAGVLHVASYLANQAVDELEGLEEAPRRVLDFAHLNTCGADSQLQEWNQLARDWAEKTLSEDGSRAA